MQVRKSGWALPALTEKQQALVMRFYKLTKGLGHKMQLTGKVKGKGAIIQALKQEMLKAGISGEIIYGDKPTEKQHASSWVRSA